MANPFSMLAPTATSMGFDFSSSSDPWAGFGAFNLYGSPSSFQTPSYSSNPFGTYDPYAFFSGGSGLLGSPFGFGGQSFGYPSQGFGSFSQPQQSSYGTASPLRGAQNQTGASGAPGGAAGWGGGGLYADIVPGGRYGSLGKWSGGTGIDVFAPRGTPVNAPFSGRVMFQSVNAPGAPAPIGVAYLVGSDGMTIRVAHVRGVGNGYVQAGQPFAMIDDDSLSPSFQHADITISSTGQFAGPPPQGGDIDARQFLQRIGYRGQALPVKTLGPMEMMMGADPFSGGGGGFGGGGFGMGSPFGGGMMGMNPFGMGMSNPFMAGVGGGFGSMGGGFGGFPGGGMGMGMPGMGMAGGMSPFGGGGMGMMGGMPPMMGMNPFMGGMGMMNPFMGMMGGPMMGGFPMFGMI